MAEAKNIWCPRGIYSCDCGASYCEERKPRSQRLFITGYFTDRTSAGDRLDPATGKVININRKD